MIINGDAKIVKKRIQFLTVLIIAIALVGCQTPVKKQPIPSRPLVSGDISGLPSNVSTTIYVRTLKGWETRKVKLPTPDRWKVVVTEASGVDYIVSAEAEGYVSQPISYTIRIEGDTAYVVQDGQVTDEEAIHLDFHFVPK